jgi:hypothetical protein
MKTLLTIIVIALWLTGCSSMSTGTVTGGHTELERRVDTAGPRHYTQHERIIRINPPAPTETSK